MIIRITMKTPDALDNAILEAANNHCDNIGYHKFYDEYSRAEEMDNLTLEAKAVCKKWFKYNEYVELEVDTDSKTIRVIEQ